MSTAIVTGASSGIGYEFAKVLAKNKYQLVLVARNLERLNEIKEEIETKYSVNVILIPADLSLDNIAENIFKEVKYRQLNVEVLVNNAGFGYCGYYTQQPWENEKEMIQVNIKSVAQLTKLVLPLMLDKKKGRICNVASTAAFQPGPLMAVYYATKAYVLHYSEALASELKKTGVTVTCLCPGPTESNFQDKAKMKHVRFLKFSRIATSKQVAEYGYEAMMAGKTVAIYGILNRVLQFSTRFMPRKTVTSFVRYMQSGRK